VLLSVSVGSTDSRSLAIGTEQTVFTDLRLSRTNWNSPNWFFEIHPDGDRIFTARARGRIDDPGRSRELVRGAEAARSGRVTLDDRYELTPFGPLKLKV
jgi:hypothetical protein